MTTRQRTLVEVFQAHGDALLDAVVKVRPAIVTAVNGQTVSVQMAIQNPVVRDGGLVFDEAHVLNDVPLISLRGGGFSLWLPVAVGDSVLLVFSDVSTDTWRESDGSRPVQPGWVGKHPYDSAFAIPGIAPDSKALQTAPGGTLVIGRDGASAQIQISSSDIKIGASASQALALAPFIDTFIKAFLAATPVANDGGAAIQTAVLTHMTSAGWSPTATTGTSLGKGSP